MTPSDFQLPGLPDAELTSDQSNRRSPVEPSADSVSGFTPDEVALTHDASHDSASTDEREKGLHVSSLLFMVAARIKSYLIPAIGALGATVAAPGGRSFFFYLLGIGFAVTLLSDIVRFFTLRYQIKTNELAVRQGLILRRQRNIRLDRIQNIDLVQNFFHRIFRVAEIRIETASGTEPEATFKVLSLADVESLRSVVANVKSEKPEATDQSLTATDQCTDNVLLRISAGELVKLGLIGNRGLIMLAIVAGVFYEMNWFELLSLDWAEKQLETLSNAAFPFQAIAWFAILALLFILLRVLSAIWFVLRFYDYKLSVSNTDFRVRGGLFTKVSATVPRKRIQFISVSEPFLARWIGRASIRIETAGGAGIQNEDAGATLGRKWFVPIVPRGRVNELLNELRTGITTENEAYDWKPLAPGARKRMIRKAVILSCLIAVGSAFFIQWWAFLVGAISATGLVLYSIRYSRSLKYARFRFGLVYRSGLLERKMSFTFFDKIQAVKLVESPFDRRWKMAGLSVDTAAAGPADHRIDVPYLDAEFAHQEFAAICECTSQYSLQLG